MIKPLVFSFLLILLFIGNIYSQRKIEQGLNQITPELLKRYIDFLASDSMKGRNTPSPQLDIAADYIAKEFESLGIQKVNGSYFQNIPFCTKNLDINNCLLKIALGDNSEVFKLKTDYTPFEATSSSSVSSSIVFAGYGITAPEYNYDDYKDIDAKGRIVLIMKHEPGEKDLKSPFSGDQDSKYSMLASKFDNAKKHGAIAVLVVTDPLNHIAQTLLGFNWARLSKFTPKDNSELELCVEKPSIPLVQIGESVIRFLFGSIDSLKSIQGRIDKNFQPHSFLIVGTTCELATKLNIREVFARNVIGYFEGNDPKQKNELIIIGGHYDHIGYKERYRMGEDYIFNGADDNASGSAGVLAVARAFSYSKFKPKRSILFILFAGEEKGLYGSEYYCNNPMFTLNNTVAMFNMDMISRNGNDSIEIEGDLLNPDLAKIVRLQNRRVGLSIVEPKEDLFARSDQYNFFKKEISVIGFTSGLHSDYHTVMDDPQSTNPLKAALISKLVFRVAWAVSNQKKHYTIIKRKR